MADAQGLRYYGAATLAGRLHLSGPELDTARRQLIDLHLVAYQASLYQVLAPCQGASRRPPRLYAPTPVRNRAGAPISLAQLIEIERTRAGL